MLPNPWIILGVVFVIIGAAISGYFKGRHDEHAAVVAIQLEQQKAATVEVAKRADITETVAEKAEEKAVEIRTVTKTIIRKVPEYVTREVVRECVVPRGFIRLLNDSADGVATVPGSSGGADGAPAGIGLDTVGASVAGNYGSCRETAARLTALQDWVREQQAFNR